MKDFKRYIPIILLILHCGLIFFLAVQDGEKSANISDGVVKTVLEVTPTVEVLEKKQFKRIGYSVRKIGHFVMYLMLGVFAYLSAETKGDKRKIAAAVLFCLACAVNDELQQSFSDGRTGRTADVILDLCGGFTGTALMYRFGKKLKPDKILTGEL